MINIKNLPKSVKLMETAPRDGLQNEAKLVDTIDKIAFIEALVASGIKHIEITAFVRPQWIPALADHMEVALGVNKHPDVSYIVLVPNVQGYERALSTNINAISLVVSASSTHNQKNLNGDTAKVLARYQEISLRAHADKIPFRAYVSCSFGCPYEGEINKNIVVDMALRLLDMGAYEIAISDTIGRANPFTTQDLLESVLKFIPPTNIALHLHDTRGMALANILVALNLGIASFDSSAGGMGGCPYAKGASGNVASEDLVNMLESLGMVTGISLTKLCQASLMMEGFLGKKLDSKILAMARACGKDFVLP